MMPLRSIQIVACVNSSFLSFFLFFFLLYSTIYQSLCNHHSLKSIWIIISVWLLQVKLLWTIVNTFCVDLSFHFFIPKSVIAGSYGKYTFKMIRNCQTFFQSVCTILHSHWNCISPPASLHPCLHLVLTPFIGSLIWLYWPNWLFRSTPLCPSPLLTHATPNLGPFN